MIVALAVSMLICALVPAVLFCINLRRYAPPPEVDGHSAKGISVLIPARDEADGIAEAVQCALASRAGDCEVIVMDDGSSDGTDAVVLALAEVDARVRLAYAPSLPAEWNGKQHACWALARIAKHPVLCFVDADVRLEPDCLARMVGFLETSGCGLVSGFPRLITGSFLEWMLLPLIHFVLLGFLPMGRMRRGTDPAFAAGCGQFMLVRAKDYFACGGHSGIKLTMHDGLRLPRLFREHGIGTDLADITELASCRMYHSAGQVWSGLAKNATEGIASPGRIFPVTMTLLLGQVFPFVAFLFACTLLVLRLIVAILFGTDVHLTHPTRLTFFALFILICISGSWLVRTLAVRRFRQDWRGALLHPFGILLLLAVQWYALVRQILRRPVSWRTRDYVAGPG